MGEAGGAVGPEGSGQGKDGGLTVLLQALWTVPSGAYGLSSLCRACPRSRHKPQGHRSRGG